ncbi:uncharacterized protein [Pempheris klunzingeri]|uniref:uncharacterized protein n=1 Tax=Pempheris klunzingeri TaxID=3127111 RepID=UPI00397F5591
MEDCNLEMLGLALLFLALLISLCLNVIFCIRRKATLCRDECCCPQIHEEESPQQDERRYFHNLDHEQQENPHNHNEQQENPIYGNISTDRRGSVEVCYEMMTMQSSRDRVKHIEPDLNYASLDLKLAKKHKKKHRHQQGHIQGRNQLPDQLPVHLTPPASAFLEVEADVDAHLPSRDTSTMVSQSSIYLNSQQIAQEAEEMEKERGMNVERENVGWEGIRGKDGESGEWKDEQESEESKDVKNYSNGSVFAQLSEVEAFQSGTDHFIGSFSHESNQHD